MPPVFALLESELIVQEKDMTRFDASRSFASGAPAISVIQIKPSKTAASVDVSATGKLDWLYEFKLDVDDTNPNIDLFIDGGNLTARIPDGEYTLAELATAIDNELNGLGTSVSFVVTATADNKIKIVGDGDFTVLGATGPNLDGGSPLMAEIGITEDLVGSATVPVIGVEIESVQKKVTVTVENANDPTPDSATISRTLTVKSESADKLFASDELLRKHEPEIMRYLPAGRASYKDVHRRVQELILAWLDTQGFTDSLGEKFTLARILDTEEVEEWATMMALRLIFEGVSNAVDDAFAEKAKRYKGLEEFYRGRAVLRIDTNQDGTVDVGEQVDIRSAVVVRR